MVTGAEIEIGATVMTADGKALGQVREIAHHSFKVGRTFSPDLWLGNEYVDHVSGGVVQMMLTKGTIDMAKVEPGS